MRLIGYAVCAAIAVFIGSLTSPVTAGEVRVPIGPYGSGPQMTIPVNSAKEIREEGVTLQKLDFSCGSAAISTIFTSYLRQPYTEEEVIDSLIRVCDINTVLVRKGFSLLDLKRFAEMHGVIAEGYELDYDSLNEFSCPVLVPLYRANVNMRHFVIFRGASDGRVFLADPAMGRRVMSREEFESTWNPKVGMVFTNPEQSPMELTPLHVSPADATYLSPDNLRGLLLNTAIQYIQNASEF